MQTKKFRLVEVNVGNANILNFPLQVDQVLQDAKRITAIEAFSVTNITNSKYSGAALQADAVFKQAFLTLMTKEGNEEVISHIPLQSLNAIANNGKVREFAIPAINVTKCYVGIAENQNNPADVTKVFLLGFHYES